MSLAVVLFGSTRKVIKPRFLPATGRIIQSNQFSYKSCILLPKKSFSVTARKMVKDNETVIEYAKLFDCCCHMTDIMERIQ